MPFCLIILEASKWTTCHFVLLSWKLASGLDAILSFSGASFWKVASYLCVLKEPWALMLSTLLFVNLLVSCLHCLHLEFLLSLYEYRGKELSPLSVSLLGCVRL